MKKLTLEQLSNMSLNDMYKHKQEATDSGDAEYIKLVNRGYSNILHLSIWGTFRPLPYPLNK